MLKEAIRAALAAVGVRITRTIDPHRFDAMAVILGQLRLRGFVPKVVVDVGANMGQWTRMAMAEFPSAKYHLVEPQPSCAPRLREIASRHANIAFHPVAATSPGVQSVSMVNCDESGFTGAYVSRNPGVSDPVTSVQATTLDDLLATTVRPDDRTLLKLDVEGHELSALQGATAILAKVEVVILESHVFDPEALGRATTFELLARLNESEFTLYDVASLSPRKRDGRLRQADIVCVRRGSALLSDDRWS